MAGRGVTPPAGLRFGDCARAGDNAASLYASSEAADNYGRAIELAGKLPDGARAELLIGLYQKRGRARLALGRFGEAVDDFTEMLDEARRTGSPEQESAALNALSMTLFYSHRLDEITERAAEILRAAERAQSDALRIEAMQVLALKHLGSGDLAEAKRMLDEIIESARRLGHKSVLLTGLAWRGVLEAQANSLINLGIDHNQSGRGEKTASAFREVEQIFRRDAWFRWRYQIRLHAAAAEHQLALGDLARAEEHALRLLETATHYEARKYVAVAHRLLAEAAIARGDLAKAAGELDAALRELRTHPVPVVAWKTFAAVGRLRALESDADGAREGFTRAASAVNEIADGVRDEHLRNVFLNSAPVREVFAGARVAIALDQQLVGICDG